MNKVQKLAYSGIFIAISIILTRFFGHMLVFSGAQLRLSFGEIPLILSGILLGPLYGAACGGLADLIGFPLNPHGGLYFPGFTLSSMLVGMLPGLMAKWRKRDWTWMSLLLVIGITIFITSIILNTIWLNMIIGRAIALILPPRILANIILIPIYVTFVNIILKQFKRL